MLNRLLIASLSAKSGVFEGPSDAVMYMHSVKLLHDDREIFCSFKNAWNENNENGHKYKRNGRFSHQKKKTQMHDLVDCHVVAKNKQPMKLTCLWMLNIMRCNCVK